KGEVLVRPEAPGGPEVGPGPLTEEEEGGETEYDGGPGGGESETEVTPPEQEKGEREQLGLDRAPRAEEYSGNPRPARRSRPEGAADEGHHQEVALAQVPLPVDRQGDRARGGEDEQHRRAGPEPSGAE